MLNYDDDDYSHTYGQIEEEKLLEFQQKLVFFNHIYQILISDLQMFGLMMLVIIYVFDIKSQQNFTAFQGSKVEFKLDGVVSNDISGYALVLTNKLKSISSDGQRHCDLISV